MTRDKNEDCQKVIRALLATLEGAVLMYCSHVVRPWFRTLSYALPHSKSFTRWEHFWINSGCYANYSNYANYVVFVCVDNGRVSQMFSPWKTFPAVIHASGRACICWCCIFWHIENKTVCIEPKLNDLQNFIKVINTAQFNWPHHLLLVVCSNLVSVLYRFWDMQRQLMAYPWHPCYVIAVALQSSAVYRSCIKLQNEWHVT